MIDNKVQSTMRTLGIQHNQNNRFDFNDIRFITQGGSDFELLYKSGPITIDYISEQREMVLPCIKTDIPEVNNYGIAELMILNYKDEDKKACVRMARFIDNPDVIHIAARTPTLDVMMVRDAGSVYLPDNFSPDSNTDYKKVGDSCSKMFEVIHDKLRASFYDRTVKRTSSMQSKNN